MSSDSRKHPYNNPYYPDNVYGHAVKLLIKNRKAALADHVHLDIGSGFGSIAKPLVDTLGVHYIGVDRDCEALASLRERNLEAHSLQIDEQTNVLEALRQILAGRRVASITMLDVLEHLPNGASVLHAIHQIAAEYGALIVISVPNVSHQDVGLKLAFGRWDYTEAGLLDHTHFRFFTFKTLEQTLEDQGLHVVDRNDVRVAQSDQYFPADHPALTEKSLLSSLLRRLQASANTDHSVLQFVCACVAGPTLAASLVEPTQVERPFLSIVTRTQGTRLHTLREVFVALAGQTDTDFELVVLGHRLTLEGQKAIERAIDDNPKWLREKTRLIRVDYGNRTTPLNIGFEQARGQYISILDDDDLPFGHWVETFHKLAKANYGRILRASCVRQEVKNVDVLGKSGLRAIGSPLKMYASEFDWVDHLQENQTPPVSLAFPCGVFHHLHERFDESLTTTEDWDYLMRTAGVVGVASSPEITSIYRWWNMEQSSRTEHPSSEWITNYHQVLRKLDSTVNIIPVGVVSRIRQLFEHKQVYFPEFHFRIAKFIAQVRQERMRLARHHAELKEESLSFSRDTLRMELANLQQRLKTCSKPAVCDQQLLLESIFFDASWYRLHYTNALAGADPVSDYLAHGNERNPGPAFDGLWYLKRYDDVLQSGTNPLIHYLRYGQMEARDIRPVVSVNEHYESQLGLFSDLQKIADSQLFDDFWYCEKYPEVLQAKLDPIEHYLLFGAEEGRNPGPNFDGNWYLERYQDVAKSNQNPLVHYLRFGIDEGRMIRPVV